MTPREKAVDALVEGMSDLEQMHLGAELGARVDALLTRLGFVHVDTALVVRLREAHAADGGAIVRTYCDGGESTDFGDACQELGEAALEQTGGVPPPAAPDMSGVCAGCGAAIFASHVRCASCAQRRP